MTTGSVARYDAERLVDAAFGDAISSSTGWYRAPCPFCVLRLGKQDRRRSLGILAGEWAYHCFRCKAAGKLRQAPTGSESLDLPDLEEEDYYLGPPEDFSELLGDDSMMARRPRQYMLDRKVGKRVWKDLGIGYCTSGRAAFRVVVPVKAADKQTWLGWVGRAYSKSAQMKYVYPPGMKRGGMLFNGDALLTETDVPAIVVEGVFDALPHWPNAVACLGKPTRDQFEILAAARRPVVVALDGDAWKEGEALSMRLGFEGKQTGWIKFPPMSDPGDVNRKELLSRAYSALT